MSERTLLLTREYLPHKVIPWEKAINMIFQGKVDVVDEYDDVIGAIPASRVHEFREVAQAYGHKSDHSESIILRIPCVIRLHRAVGAIKRGVKFSRINVYTRDGFKCCYCGASKPVKELNYDHILPRHHGGKTTWENIVTSCYPCNTKKRNRTPMEAGMSLCRVPYKPKILPSLGPYFDPRSIPEQWVVYCIPMLSGEFRRSA